MDKAFPPGGGVPRRRGELRRGGVGVDDRKRRQRRRFNLGGGKRRDVACHDHRAESAHAGRSGVALDDLGIVRCEGISAHRYPFGNAIRGGNVAPRVGERNELKGSDGPEAG